MIGNRRGVSAKDLRPFSVEDPLGQGRAPSAARAARAASFGPPREERPSERAEAPRPAAAAQIARLGCLAVMAIWAMGLVASAATWLPTLLREVRPALERALAEWEAQRDGAEPPKPADTPAAPEPRLAPPPVAVPGAPGDPLAAPPDPAADPAQAEIERVCARTVACCLTVQGERARSLCENFRGLPVADPCVQAYEAFAQVGRQLGRPCQE